MKNTFLVVILKCRPDLFRIHYIRAYIVLDGVCVSICSPLLVGSPYRMKCIRCAALTKATLSGRSLPESALCVDLQIQDHISHTFECLHIDMTSNNENRHAFTRFFCLMNVIYTCLEKVIVQKTKKICKVDRCRVPKVIAFLLQSSAVGWPNEGRECCTI